MKIYKNKFHEWSFDTVYVTDAFEARTILNTFDCSKLYGLDIETSKKPEWKDHEQAGLCPILSDIRLLQIYDGDSRAYVFDLRQLAQEPLLVSLALLRDFLKKGRFVAHNAVFEIQHLLHAGIPDVNGGCSMLMSQLVYGAEHSPMEEDPEDDDTDKDGMAQYRKTGHSLDTVTQRLFGVKVAKQQQTSDWSVEELSVDQITYAGLDAVLTYKCAKALLPKIKEYKLERHYKLLKDTQHVIARMQLSGLPMDWDYHKKLMDSWVIEKEAARRQCEIYFGSINMSSGKQMNAWLIEHLKNRPLELAAWPKTKKGSYTFTRTALGAFLHLPEISTLLKYKKYTKLLDTYGESIIEKKHPVTGRLHTSYTLGMTHTGRLSSRSPNIQNFPRDKEFRNIFKAPEGYELVVSDFSQIETRLQAEFSKDPVMCESYREKKDLYKIMASSIYKVPIESINKTQRFVGKTCVLALGYGMGSKKMGSYALNAGVKESDAFWATAHKTYHNTFKVYSNWCDKIRDRARKLGYIDTLLGKRRKLEEDELYTRAPNTVIQGTGAELMLLAMCKCKERCSEFAQMVASVHDEILLCVRKEDTERAIQCLSQAMCESMIELFPNAVSHEVADASAAVAWGDAKAEL
jgi:DNA polymerase-1